MSSSVVGVPPPSSGVSLWGHRMWALARRPVQQLGRWVVVVLVVVLILSVCRVFGPLTYPGDIWRQSDTAAIARNFARDGMRLFWPQIDWGGAGPGYVETELPLLPWLAAGLYLVIGEHPGLGRLVSLVFLAAALAAFWGLARRLLPLTAARWALVAFAVSPVVMRWGTAFMPDVAALAATVVALLMFCRWLAEDRLVLLITAGAATSLAALVKPTALNVLLVMALWLSFTHRERWRRPMLYVVGMATLILPGAWLWHAATLHRDYGNTFGVISGGDSKWGSVALWLSAQFYAGNLRAEALFVYGLFGLPFAVVGVVWLWRRRRGTMVTGFLAGGVIGLAVYYAATGRYSGSDLGLQYHVYSLPYAATAVGAGVPVALRRVRAAVDRRRGPRWVVPAVAVMVVLALGGESANVWRRSFSDDSGVLGVCATALARVSAPHDLVVVGTDSTSVVDGVSNNFQEPVVFFRADRKGWSLPADRYDPAVLAGYRDQGARFFVNPEPSLLRVGGPLTVWLATDAVPAATQAAGGCDIWALPAARG